MGTGQAVKEERTSTDCAFIHHLRGNWLHKVNLICYSCSPWGCWRTAETWQTLSPPLTRRMSSQGTPPWCPRCWILSTIEVQPDPSSTTGSIGLSRLRGWEASCSRSTEISQRSMNWDLTSFYIFHLSSGSNTWFWFSSLIQYCHSFWILAHRLLPGSVWSCWQKPTFLGQLRIGHFCSLPRSESVLCPTISLPQLQDKGLEGRSWECRFGHSDSNLMICVEGRAIILCRRTKVSDDKGCIFGSASRELTQAAIKRQ